MFVKSKRKGFSAIISVNRLKSSDSEIRTFLHDCVYRCGDTLLLAKYLPLRSDSLGARETRHFIFNNKVINSSRYLYNLQHIVPRSHIEYAGNVADRIKALGSFPSNYVLDVGEFQYEDGSIELDVVELNPVSCSTCYINNSIFDELVREAKEQYNRTHMGFEFCYDSLSNPQEYIKKRISNANYSHHIDGVYCFL